LLSMDRIRQRWSRSRLEIVLIALIASALMCLLAYASGFLRDPWKALALSIGSGTLGGGVFAFLTKLAQLGGVIREELEAVVFSTKHLSVRSDRQELWANATRSLFGNSFPDLMAKLSADVLRNMLPSGQRYYLRQARRHIRISLEDRSLGKVRVCVQFQATLRTESENVSERVERKSWYVFVPQSIAEEDQHALLDALRSRYWLKHSFDPTTPVPPLIVDNEVGRKTLPSGEVEVEFKATLAPAAEYIVRDGGTVLQSTHEDNVICFVAASYIDGLEVPVDFPARDLVLQFHPLGGARFEDEYPKAATIHKKTNDLLFANDGFLLTIQLRHAQKSGASHEQHHEEAPLSGGR
jgi:hypothetical protein